MEDADYAPEPGEAPMLEKLSREKFEERLAEQMVVPAEFLTINYGSSSKTPVEQIYFPYGWTTRKQ